MTWSRLSTWQSRGIAFAVAVAGATLAVLGLRWELVSEPRKTPQSEPVVDASSVAPPIREIPPPLPGNDSSIAGKTQYLILTGTVVAADPRNSLAFIGTDPKNPQTYAVNSLLVNGARVREIARDHVVLEMEGYAAKVEIGGAWREPTSAARRLTVVSAADVQPDVVAESMPQSLTDGMSISPVFDANGMLTSYRLRPGRFGGVFARWGLEPGDRLVAIENSPLSDVDATSQMLELVGRGETLHATIQRNGTRVQVVLDGTAIAEEIARARSATGLLAAPSSG